MQGEFFGVKLTRFQIEGWLELIGTPSVDILHQSDCAWLTPPIAEIIWVKNVRAIVVCGFLMK
jgi:hypothetical protein